MAEDAAGNLWFGTALGELRHYQDGHFTTFRPTDSLMDETTLRMAAAANPMGLQTSGALSGGERFWALHFDGEGSLWIGTLGGGFLRFKDGKFFRFRSTDGLPSDCVSQILEDNRNRLWLGTRAGVVRVDRRDLNQFADGGKEHPNFVVYGKSDGLPALECFGGSQPACWRGQDGRLWFTTVRGAVWVDPAALRFNHRLPPVHLNEVRVDGHSLQPNAAATDFSKKLLVSAGSHYFEFGFCGLSFTAPERVKFRWRLGNLEKDWVDGGVRRSASYSYLPPGDYHFEVTACNNHGIWNEQGARLSFQVLPLFWQTVWFKLLIGMAVVTVLLFLYRVRVLRLRALERLRQQIARDLHDEVGANLGSISLLTEVMEHLPQPGDLAQIRSTADQTVDTLRDLVWIINPSHEYFTDLLARLKQIAAVMLANVAYEFVEQGPPDKIKLSLELRRNVPPLFKEVLNNIRKHSQANHVAIQLYCRDGNLVLEVKDNGVGFEVAKKGQGNGLKNFQHRAVEMRAELIVVSQPKRGTTVKLTAPITKSRDWRRRLK